MENENAQAAPTIAEAVSCLDEALKGMGHDLVDMVREKYSELYSFIGENIKNYIPPSTKRVAVHTSPEAQKRIWSNTVDSVARCIEAGDEAIAKRMEELEYEWDIERVLETNAASMALFGTLMSFKNRGWIILPLVVSAFLLQHGVQGWCPPLPVFRNMGVRTSKEIDDEYNVLKRIRGDFGEFDRGQKDPRSLAIELLKWQDEDFSMY